MRKAGEKAPTARRPWGRRAGMCWRACGHYPAPGFGGDSPVSPGVLTESGLVEVSLELLVRVALAFDPRQRETQPLIPRRHRPRTR